MFTLRDAVSLTVGIFLCLPLAAFGQGAQSSAPTTNLPSIFPRGETSHPVSITGQVVLEDGTPVPEIVEIQRVCGGMVQRLTSTNTRGKYNIVLSEDGSDRAFQGASEGGGSSQFGAQLDDTHRSTTTRTVLWGCDLRGSLPGYISSSVSLAGKDFSMPVTLSPIVLHRIVGVQGDSISAVSARAPEEARKELDKGREDFQKTKYADAEKHLSKAVKLYPEYSVAWDLRGRAQRMQKQNEDAEKSFLKAIAADEKFIPPYIQLAGLDASQAKWSDVLKLTGKAIELDPLSYPDAHFLQGFAYYNLKQMAEAESSIRKAVELDKDHHFPRAELLLGRILQKQGDTAGAAEHLRNFLKLEPSTPEAGNIKAFLAKADEASAKGTAPKTD